MAEQEGVDIPITASGGDAAAREIAKPTESLKRYMQVARQANAAEKERERTLASLAREAEKAAAAELRATQAREIAQIKLLTAMNALSPVLAKVEGEWGKLAQGIGQAGNAAMAATTTLSTMGGTLASVAGPIGALVGGLGLIAAAFEALDISGARAQARLTAIWATSSSGAEREASEARYQATMMAHSEAEATRMLGESPEDRDRRTKEEFARYLSVYGNAEQRGESRGGGGGRRDDFNQFISSTAARADFSLSTEGDPRSYGLAGRSPLNTMSESIGAPRRGSSQTSQAVKDAEQVKGAWLDAYAAIGDAGANVFAALITGGKDAATAALAATGDMLVAEGSRAVFSGLFQTALGNPLGPTMIAIGGSEIAFGMGLGAVIGGASAGGGGGGGRPTPVSRADAGRDAGPTVVNVYALNPTREAGRSIEQSVRAVQRKRVSN